MRLSTVFVLVLGLMGSGMHDAKARDQSVVGSWFFNVIPQPVPSGIPTPPPFIAVINLQRGGTVVETDSSIHPTSMVPIFPGLPPLSAGDGLGSWRRIGRARIQSVFVKIVFDDLGNQLGIIRNTLKLGKTRRGTLEGEGISDFVLGSEPEAEPFFSGPIVLKGSKISPN